MTLTEALKKSSVVSRASEPKIVYEAVDGVLHLQENGETSAIPMSLDLVTATDWRAEVVTKKWIGSREPKESNSK